MKAISACKTGKLKELNITFLNVHRKIKAFCPNTQ